MCNIMVGWFKEWQFWISCVSVAGVIFSAYKYFDSRKAKQKQQEFENYHKLIERINRSLKQDESISLQVQQAAIYELRNYKRYTGLTVKLLKYWKDDDNYKDVVNDTLKYICKNRLNDIDDNH